MSRTLSLALRTRLVRAGAAVTAALAVATCGGDAPTAVANVVVFAVQPANTQAGSPIAGVRVEIRNSSGTIITSFTDNVTLAITTGTGTAGAILSGTSTVAAGNGVATFNDLSINRSGTAYRLTASTSTLAPATSSTFDIAAGAMSEIVFAVPPSAATAGSAITPAVQVTARDALGNTATSFTGSVTMAIGTNPGGAVLSGTTSVNAVAGVATFSNLILNRSAPGFTLTASTAGPPNVSVGSATFTVSPGAPSALQFTAQPSNATAGATITPAIAVTAVDAQGNVATGFAGAITLAIGTNPGGGTLNGTTTAGAVNGVATFANVNVNRTGTGYTLAASSGGLAGATSATFDIAAGVTSQLAFTVQPSTVIAGAVIAPAVVVQAQDAAGNLTSSFTGNVAVTIVNNAGGGTLTGTASAAAVGGVATFASLSIDKPGTGYTLGAAAGGLAGATSAGFNVVAGPAATLAFSVDPVTTAAGATITPAVRLEARDALGNVATGFTSDVTVAIGNNPSGGVLSGSATVAAVAGVAIFADLSINKVGVGYTLTAGGGSLPGVVSAAFNITAGPPAAIEFTVQPTSTTAGAAISPAVQITARDNLGNVATDFTGNVTLALQANPGGATLSGTATQAAVAGIATFAGLSIDKVGIGYTLAATSTAVPGVTSATFDIAVGAPAQLVFTVEPTNAVAGAAISPAVVAAARDAFGNLATGFTGNVTVAIGNNPGGGTLSGTATVAAAGGLATFANLSINRSGVGYTLFAASGALTGATSAAFTITPGAATQLAFAVQPAGAVAGVAIAPAVQVAAHDAFGNVDPTFVGDVTVAIANNAGGGTLSGTLTVAASAGVASFGTLSVDRTGVGYTLGATGGSLTAATSAGFTISAAVATTIEFGVQPTSAAVGAAIAPPIQVTARDALGNVATGFAGTVTIAIANNAGGGTLSGTASLAAVAGVATFANLSIDKVGVGYTLGASAGALPAATSAAFDITPGAAAKLVFTVQPASASAGVAIAPSVQVTAQDAFNNLVPTFTGNVTVAIGTNPGVPPGVLSGTVVRAAVGGVATFDNLSINRSGTGYTLGATSGALTAATSAGFNIVAGPATVLGFGVQPVNTVAGVAIAPSVQVAARDALGNVDLTFTGNITVAIANNPSTGTLGGTATVAAVAGVATFANLTIDRAGIGYTLGATSGALTAATSAGFNITAGALARVGFSVQPTNRTAGLAITPSVQVQGQDAFGNLVSTFTGNVTVAITAGTGKVGATLSGTLTRTAVAGVATFNNLSIDSAATGYTLTATSGVLTAGVSTAFDITPGTANRFGFSVQPVNTVAGVVIAPSVVVTARDALGNVVPSFTGNITVAILTNPGVPPGVLSGTLVRPAVAGVGATFNNLSINRTGVGYTLRATGTLTAATSAPFNITPGAPAALFFTAQPSNVNVNGVITPDVVVTARDALGNVATQFVNNVTMAIGTNPGGGALNGSVNRAGVNGVATFTNLSITAPGVGYTLTAASTGLTGAISTPFTVNPPAPATLVFTVQPATTVAGQVITPVVQVTARDASGTIVPTYTDPVTVAISSGAPGGVLSGTLTQGAVGGVASFGNLSINRSGTYKLSASAAGLPDGFSSFFTINPGAATEIVFSVPPSNASAGAIIIPQIQLTARDALGNTVTTYPGPVSLAITSGTGTGGALLTGGGAIVPTNGVASFPAASINAVGAGYTLTATGTSGALSAVSGPFDITPGAGQHLQFQQGPSVTVAGATITPAVTVAMLNAVNAIDVSFTGPVTVAIEAGSGGTGAVLSGTTTVNAVAGIATFNNLSINRTGNDYRLVATAAGAAGARSGLFAITAGAAARLDFLTQPVTDTAGQVMPLFTVRALDAFGNVNTAFAGPVTVAISTNPGGGTLSGTLTVNAVAGTATFSTVSINKSGTGYRLEATSGALTPDVSNAFSILGGAPVRLAFTVQPTNTPAGGNITPVVRVTGFDALDNIATFGVGETITLAITPGTGNPLAVLTNGGPLAPVSGVASFNLMSINLAGLNYTLTASSGALPTVASTTFNIN